MSYFYPKPKTNRSDLYDMDEELREFGSLIENSPFIVVKGLRRTGKTSLLYTGVNEFKAKAVFLDLRSLPYEGMIAVGKFVNMVCDSINRFLEGYEGTRGSFLNLARNIAGFQIVGTGIQFSKEKRATPDLVALTQALEKAAKGEKILLVFDEAQELRKIAKYRMDRFMAYVYDRFRNITIVVTGSEVGLLEDFLRIEDPSAPLYGRAIDEIELKPFPEEKARDFLIKGYEENGIVISDSLIEYALENLDGIVGWLTYLGWETRNKKRITRDDIDSVLRKASALAIEEFNHFLSQRWQAEDRYRTIMEICADAGKAGWKELKTVFEMRRGRINDKNFSLLLNTLRKAGFITKVNEKYKITDPILRHGLRSGR